MEESRKRQRRQESAARIYGKLCRLKPDDLSFADWTKRAELNTSFFTNLKNGSDPSVTNLHSALDVIGVTPSEFYALDETPVVHLHSAVGFLKQRAETTVTFQSGKRHGNQAA